MNTTSPPRSASSLVGALALCLVASAAAAQPFEEVFGPKDSVDRGERRVTRVRHCPQQGYVAVGTQVDTTQSRVYLVKTDPAGTMLWERVYDVGADGRPDQAFALVEIEGGTGYMITGTSERGSISPLFLMQVDCDGKDLGAAFYSPSTTSGLRVTGRDIIQARTGTPTLGTNRGDFVVAGYVENPNGAADGFMLRVGQAFPHNIVWQRRYNFDVNERLFALTETTLSGGGIGTADIVAVGEYNGNPFNTQALAMRVNGNTGNLGGGLQCAALYGGPRNEGFYSVVELRKDFPNLAMVGFSTSPGLRNDVYLVKTRETPCIQLAQSVIGNENGSPQDEIGYDLKEVLEAVDDSTGAKTGDLAITGYADRDGTRRDVFLLYAEITNLTPLSARVYGDHADRNDEGRSLTHNYEHGFVISGYSDSDFQLAGDPRDLYLVNTTNSSKTGCEKEWYPVYDLPGWIEQPVTPVATNVVKLTNPGIKPDEFDTAFINCQ